jgi:hypothetical protein
MRNGRRDAGHFCFPHLSPSSCPGLTRASTSLSKERKTWMAGVSLRSPGHDEKIGSSRPRGHSSRSSFQTARRARLIILAAEFRASSVLIFVDRSSTGAVLSHLSQKRGSRTPKGAPGMPARSSRRPTSNHFSRAASPYGAPLRRLLGSRLGLGAPLPFLFCPVSTLAGAGRD